MSHAHAESICCDDLRNAFLPALMAVTLLLSVSSGQASSIAGYSAEDPLAISDLVIRGIVENIEPGSVDISDDPGTAAPQLLHGIAVRVRVLEVLRGGWKASSISFVALHDREAVSMGREYIVCMKWYAKRKVFATAPHIGIYERHGDKLWVRRLMRQGAHYQIDPDSLTDGDLRSRVAAGSLENIAALSDIIATGRIVAIQDSLFVGASGQEGSIRHVKIHVTSLLKGKAPGGSFEFAIPRTAGVAMDIRRTPDLRVGEEWLMFLRVDNIGLYPFAWRNSLLRIDGDKLIYNSVMEYPRPRAEVLRAIQAEVRGEARE